MRLKVMLGLFALVFVTACSSDITGPSTSRAPVTQHADAGTNTVGSGG